MEISIFDGLATPDSVTLRAMLDGVAHYAYAVARREPARAAPVVPGIDQRHPVRAIAHGDLLALVSDVSLAEYNLERLRERLQDNVWLELLARGHQRVMGSLLEHYTLLPLKLCTLYTDEARVREALATNGPWFRAALDRVAGAREWGVKVFCDAATLSAWAAREAPQLRELAASVGAATPGARYLLEKRLRRAAQQTADELRHEQAEAIAARLASGAWAAQRGPAPPPQIHGRQGEMVLNGAYLVGEAEFAAFRAALEALSAEYDPRGFSFELTGPWPAYSFSGQAGQEEA